METGVDLYKLLETTTLPSHWPTTSTYRLRSIKTKVLKRTRGNIVPLKDVTRYIKKVIVDSFPIESHSSKTIKTYQSVLIRYVAEKIKGHSLQPWEAKKFLKIKTL